MVGAMNKLLKETLKEYNKHIKKFNSIHIKYQLSMYYDFNPDNQEGLHIYLYDLNGNKIYEWFIYADALDRYEPEKIIFNLIEKGYIQE